MDRQSSVPAGNARCWQQVAATASTASASVVPAREAAGRFVDELDALRRTRLSAHDRGVITLYVRGMTLSWRQQDNYASAALAKLVGVDAQAGHMPPLENFCGGPVAAFGGAPGRSAVLISTQERKDPELRSIFGQVEIQK